MRIAFLIEQLDPITVSFYPAAELSGHYDTPGVTVSWVADKPPLIMCDNLRVHKLLWSLIDAVGADDLPTPLATVSSVLKEGGCQVARDSAAKRYRNINTMDAPVNMWRAVGTDLTTTEDDEKSAKRKLVHRAGLAMANDAATVTSLSAWFAAGSPVKLDSVVGALAYHKIATLATTDEERELFKASKP